MWVVNSTRLGRAMRATAGLLSPATRFLFTSLREQTGVPDGLCRCGRGHVLELGAPRGAKPLDEGFRSCGLEPYDAHLLGKYLLSCLHPDDDLLWRDLEDAGCREGGSTRPRLRAFLVDDFRGEHQD